MFRCVCTYVSYVFASITRLQTDLCSVRFERVYKSPCSGVELSISTRSEDPRTSRLHSTIVRSASVSRYRSRRGIYKRKSALTVIAEREFSAFFAANNTILQYSIASDRRAPSSAPLSVALWLSFYNTQIWIHNSNTHTLHPHNTPPHMSYNRLTRHSTTFTVRHKEPEASELRVATTL